MLQLEKEDVMPRPKKSLDPQFDDEDFDPELEFQAEQQVDEDDEEELTRANPPRQMFWFDNMKPPDGFPIPIRKTARSR